MGLSKEKDYKFEKRSGVKRRKFSYSLYIPERRSGVDRRGREEAKSKVKSILGKGRQLSL